MPSIDKGLRQWYNAQLRQNTITSAANIYISVYFSARRFTAFATPMPITHAVNSNASQTLPDRMGVESDSLLFGPSHEHWLEAHRLLFGAATVKLNSLPQTSCACLPLDTPYIFVQFRSMDGFCTKMSPSVSAKQQIGRECDVWYHN